MTEHHPHPRLRHLGCLAALPALLVAITGVVLLWWERSTRALLLYASFLPLFLLGQGMLGLLIGTLPSPISTLPLTGRPARQWATALITSGFILLLLCGSLFMEIGE